jgi:hypothetical protein
MASLRVTAWCAVLVFQGCHVILPLDTHTQPPDAGLLPDGALDSSPDGSPVPPPDRGLDAPPLDLGPDTAPACGYAFRRAITIAANQVGRNNNAGALAAFPVVVQLTRDWLKTTKADPAKGRVTSAKGHDIIFRDAKGTDLDHEIEAYDGKQGTLTAWVRIDPLSKATPTTFYIYYGNPCVVSPTQKAAAVWDTQYKGVWHLNEEAPGTGAPDLYRDSTTNANHGDDKVTATDQLGLLAGGQQFDHKNGDFVDCGTGSSLHVKQITLSAWIWIPVPPADGTWRMVVTMHPSTNYQMYVYGKSNKTATLGGYLRLVQPKQNVNFWNWPDINIASQTWTHAAMTFDGKNLKLYVNGALDDTYPATGVIADSSGDRLLLGYKDDMNWGLHFYGSMDEVRVSDVARSGDWILTSYRNQKEPQTFYSVGKEEPVP